ncbi:hypothetical protein M885DRAFT_621338 [Pelagophyceae sp. CCMP2097]|nr:hypothetical protein M885DRAFT_621338 [Pelagophyceae sp. CCMP2097]
MSHATSQAEASEAGADLETALGTVAVLRSSLELRDTLVDAHDPMDSTPDGDNIAANLKAAVDNMVEPDLAYKKDVQALPSDSLRAELGRRGLSQEGLKAALVERLWGAVRAAFPEASGMESGDPTVKMNLHRMKQVLFHLTFLWAGKGLKWKGGGELQRVVVDLFLHDERLRGMWEARCASDAAEAAEAARVTKAAHDALVAAGFDAPMFDAALHAGGPAGWTELLDTEIRLAVVPFEVWVDGDLLPFLENFQYNVLQVMAAGKPQVQKYMLLQLERLLHYAKTCPDIIKTTALSCAALDEDCIGLLNALLGRFTNARGTMLNIKTFIHISGMMTGLHKLSKQLDALALSDQRGTGARATESTEHQRLREIYTTDSWKQTNDVASDWIKGLFRNALAGDADPDASWLEDERIEFGFRNQQRARTSLRSWLASK